jgi:DNA-directed RNA polymerase subunit RPC12/RpoP
MKIKCNICKAEFEVNEELVDTKLEWMQCPLCNDIMKNPVYNGSNI